MNKKVAEVTLGEYAIITSIYGRIYYLSRALF